ncbi:hypothetical protein GSI_14601 [Ganoderma sinense ZZ0214-1]|uniref:DUF6535 domain-containing protein n=1 Tax=Ganoderma sinense ZZ0214-1 TaxID=1077348 RepID=A0A2G8RP68_9APHY|nr:hypothetical protein GSI_14601 [Ganoderma sinense ZZ0214-1]
MSDAAKQENWRLPTREELRKELQEEFSEEQKAQVWQNAAEAVKEFHDEMIDRWQKEMDSLLVFAGLLSAVLTAFNVQTYQLLQPGPNDPMLAILEQISGQLNSFSVNTQFINSTQPSRPLDQVEIPFAAQTSGIWINSLWFSSLVCSLASASIALIVKQWLNGLTVGLSGTSRESARLRQYRLNGLLRWHVGTIVFIPSILLQVALVLFLAGLLILLWSLHPTVAIASTYLVVALFLFLLVVTVVPAIWWDCCYRSPQAVAVYIAFRAARNGAIRTLQAGTWALRHLTHFRSRLLHAIDLWARSLEETPRWRGREQSEILRATGALDRSTAVMAYTTTFATRHLTTLHVVLTDLPREHVSLCFDDIFRAWEGQWGKSAWRHTYAVRQEFMARPVLTALRHLLAIDSEKLLPAWHAQWSAQAKGLLERFLPNNPFPDVDLCMSTLSMLAVGHGDVPELALSRLENQLTMYDVKGIRLSHKACQIVLSMYEWRLKDGNPSTTQTFASFMSWIKSARGVSKRLSRSLTDKSSLSPEEEQSLCTRGRDILSYFARALQGLDWKTVASDMSPEDREAGLLRHSFSYSIELVVGPLMQLRNRPGRKFDVLSLEAISALEDAWQIVKSTHPNVDPKITRRRLKRAIATASNSLDRNFASLRSRPDDPEKGDLLDEHHDPQPRPEQSGPDVVPAYTEDTRPPSPKPEQDSPTNGDT